MIRLLVAACVVVHAIGCASARFVSVDRHLVPDQGEVSVGMERNELIRVLGWPKVDRAYGGCTAVDTPEGVVFALYGPVPNDEASVRYHWPDDVPGVRVTLNGGGRVMLIEVLQR